MSPQQLDRLSSTLQTPPHGMSTTARPPVLHNTTSFPGQSSVVQQMEPPPPTTPPPPLLPIHAAGEEACRFGFPPREVTERKFARLKLDTWRSVPTIARGSSWTQRGRSRLSALLGRKRALMLLETGRHDADSNHGSRYDPCASPRCYEKKRKRGALRQRLPAAAPSRGHVAPRDPRRRPKRARLLPPPQQEPLLVVYEQQARGCLHVHCLVEREAYAKGGRGTV